MKSLARAGLLLAFLHPVLAQETQPAPATQLPGCQPGPPLRAPADMPGEVLLEVEVFYEDGRPKNKVTRILRGVQDRRAMRHALMLVDQSLSAVCPGLQRQRVRVVLGPQRVGLEQMQRDEADAIRQH